MKNVVLLALLSIVFWVSPLHYLYAQPPCPSVIYVNDNASGLNDGSSWMNAFNDLQDALSTASACLGPTEIWVAEGTYRPTSGTNRGISFSMQNNRAIYGGFPGLPGQENDFSVRDWNANPSILSGNIGAPGANTDNSNRIIANSNLDETAVLDGFIIQEAFNTSGSNGTQGGGMRNDNASPTVRNCIFQNNSIGSSGGALANFSSSPVFINCLFINNTASAFGGAVFSQVGAPSFLNCTFSRNNANIAGGAISGNLSGTNHILINCIVWGNTAPSFISIENAQGAISSVSYSIIEGGSPGTNNLDEDPQFADPDNGDFGLQEGSPAVNTGNEATLPPTITTDLAGAPRVLGVAVDIGAYEFSGIIPTMGQWAFFLFGLVVFTLGVVGIYSARKRGILN